MSPARLLVELHKLNVQLELEGEGLRVRAPRGFLTNELVREIKLHKANLVAVLKEHERLPYDCKRAVV